MTTRDVGDRVNLQHLVYDAAGVLTNATVALSVTDPSGVVTTPSVTNSATGTYTAAFTLTGAGTWLWIWSISGAVVAVEYGQVYAANPGPPLYASLAALRHRLGMAPTDPTTQDGRLLDALESASRGIEKACHRSFGLARTATARLYYPDTYSSTSIDDFVAVTEIATDVGGGVYTDVWAASSYQLEPLNGIQDGETGWPYWRIRAIGRSFPCTSSTSRAPLRVTALWGWPDVPAPVREGCLILAQEIAKLADTSPFGVGGYGQFGIIRARENPMVAARIQPYVREPVLVG